LRYTAALRGGGHVPFIYWLIVFCGGRFARKIEGVAYKAAAMGLLHHDRQALAEEQGVDGCALY